MKMRNWWKEDVKEDAAEGGDGGGREGNFRCRSGDFSNEMSKVYDTEWGGLQRPPVAPSLKWSSLTIFPWTPIHSVRKILPLLQRKCPFHALPHPHLLPLFLGNV